MLTWEIATADGAVGGTVSNTKERPWCAAAALICAKWGPSVNWPSGLSRSATSRTAEGILGEFAKKTGITRSSARAAPACGPSDAMSETHKSQAKPIQDCPKLCASEEGL